MNTYLRLFPGDGTEQEKQLDNDELIDIAEYAVPTAWQKKMVEFGFEPMDHTLAEFMEFCERIEYGEDNGTKSKNDQKAYKGSKSTPKSNPRDGNNRKRSSDKYCVLHDTYGHDTSECKVVLVQVKQMKNQYDAQDWRSYNTHKPRKNVSWKKSESKPAGPGTSFNYAIEQAVKNRIEEQLNNITMDELKQYLKVTPTQPVLQPPSFNPNGPTVNGQFNIMEFDSLTVNESPGEINEETTHHNGITSGQVRS